MSTAVDYFFDHSGTLAEVAALMRQVLGAQLEPYQGDAEDLFCRFLSLELNLRAHDLEDDGECDFGSFRYQLGTRTPAPDDDLRDIQLSAMALIPSTLDRRGSIGSGILVYETQLLLARYRQQSGGLYDEISGRAVVFPEHLQHVVQRARKVSAI